MTTRIEKIGNATLYLGDCMDILPTLEKVDAVITDPPYGIGLDYQSETFSDSKDELKRLIDFFIPQCLAISNLVSITSGNLNHYLYPQPTWTLCWFNKAGAGVGPWGFSCWQPILVYGKDPYLRNRKGRRPDYIETSDPSEKNGHPCPKPLNFMKIWINRVAFDAKTILDPFMGSGTTGVACVQMGRSFIGIEREPAYFDIACRRIEQAYKQGQLFEHEPIIKQIQGNLL